MSARRLVLTIPTVLIVLVGALLFSSAPALALVRHEYLSQLTGFQDPVSLALDSSSNLYVVDEGNKTVDRFDSSHAPLPFSASEAYVEGGKLMGTPTGPGGSVIPFEDPTSVAVDDATGQVYIADVGLRVVDVFSSTGEYLSQLTGTPGGSFRRGPARITVNQTTGDLYIYSEYSVDLFNSAGTYISQVNVGDRKEYEAVSGDLAINEQAKDVYVAAHRLHSLGTPEENLRPPLLALLQVYGTQEVASDSGAVPVESEFVGVQTPLGSFGEGDVWLGLDQATGHLFVANSDYDVVDEFDDSTSEFYEGQLTGTPSGSFTRPQGIVVDSSNGDLYVADISGVVDIFGPDIQAPPIIEGQKFSAASNDSVKMSARIVTGGAPATYYFEYGTTTAYGSSTTTQNTTGTAPVSAQVESLSSNTEFHFRVVARNDAGVTVGSDQAFRTFPSGIQGLPDSRTYEMVTPIVKEDAEVYVPEVKAPDSQGPGFGELAEGYATQRLNQVSSDGDGVVYQGDPTHNGEGESSGNGLGSAYLATRAVNGGWSQVSIDPSGRRSTFYQGFSGDLSIGVLSSPTEDPELEEPQLPGGNAPAYYCTGDIKSDQSETDQAACDRTDLYRHSLSEENYQPLFTMTPKRTPEGFGGVIPDLNAGNGKPSVYAGSSQDMSQLLFEANDDLLEGEGTIEKELAEDVEGEIAEGRANYDYLYDWSTGGPALVDVLPEGRVARNAMFGASHARGLGGGNNPPDFSHVISTDGSRVFWSALEGAQPKALYVRENPTQRQSPLNAQGECTVAADACTIQIDKEVGGDGRFWTASSDGSKVFFTSKTGELYEYELNPTIGRPGVLLGLTPGVEVRGVLGASEDGSYVYYADSNDELHMLHYDGSTWEAPVSIATLSSEDGNEVQPISSVFQVGKAGDWVPDLGQRTAEVTPDGQGLVFMSNQSLTTPGFPDGYENKGQDEVYVYNAPSKSLSCASCNQSGEPGSNGYLPVSWSDSYIPTLVSEGGNRVFFDSDSALVSHDTNSETDVYEWEREGTGSCGQGQGARGGCIYLLSGGSSNEPSWLLGASLSGSDVFMITRAALTPEAQDEFYKVFDARIDGIKPVSPPACTGTGCQGVPSAPPTFATPSSVTYNGIGNFLPSAPVSTKAKTKSTSLSRAQKLMKALKACKRKPKRQRASCEKQARKSFGPQSRIKRSSGSKRGKK